MASFLQRLTGVDRLEREIAARDAQLVELKETITVNQLLERMASLNFAYAGESVTPANAMRCTTVQGIVRALTNAIGSYPVSVGQAVMGDNGPAIEERPSHGLNRLLAKPNAVHTSTEYFRLVATHALLYGNHYSLKGQGKSGPISFLRPVEDPDRVSLDSMNSQTWGRGAVWRVNLDSGEMFVPQARMFHVTSGIPSADGITGESPVQLAKQAIGICLAAERLIAQLYGNNDIPTMALTGGKFRDKEHYTEWVKRFQESKNAISGGRGGTLLLPEGMEAQEMSFSPVDAQLLEMRKFQRIEIAQVYGVPPHKLADLERATFSNIEEQSLEFVRDVAKPLVRLLQQALERDLLTDADRRAGYVIRFDMAEATEGKILDRLQAFAKAHEVGAMNPNEIRQRIGLNPRADAAGDDYVVPMNMRTSNDLPGPTQDPAAGGANPSSDSQRSQNSLRAVR